MPKHAEYQAGIKAKYAAAIEGLKTQAYSNYAEKTKAQQEVNSLTIQHSARVEK